MSMDDASLAVFLGLNEDEARIIIPDLTPERRALYERMADVCVDLSMGVTPPGVIVCRDHRRKSS